MKKMLVICFVAIMTTAATYAAPVSEKVLNPEIPLEKISNDGH